ncbi:MAG: sigma-70 family RNA polymerase sigma factor [Fuerstiella sp.]
MRNAPGTRPSLIVRLRNRQGLDAWQQFVEIYQPLVFRLARRKGFQHSDAADISQEVLLRVAGAVERWDGEREHGSFRGWLSTIARNLMINFLAREKRHPIVGAADAVAELIDQQSVLESTQSKLFDEEFERQVFAWAAERIRSSFQDSTWQAFWRTAVDGVPAAQVAGEAGLSVATVYVSRSRVIRKLRSEVQKVLRENERRDKELGEVAR